MGFSWTRMASAHNGEISFRVVSGITEVYVNGYGQSDIYLRDLWRDAFQHVTCAVQAPRVLMLGLGGGIAVNEIYSRFPGCHMTAVEWDPLMVRLFQRYGKPKHPITIIEGDAVIEMPKMAQKFDVILVDLFTGGIPSAELAKDSFVRSLSEALSPSGCCVLNAFETQEFFAVFARHFLPCDKWRFEYNFLATYRQITD